MCSINYMFSLTFLKRYDIQLDPVHQNFIVDSVLGLEFQIKQFKYTRPINVSSFSNRYIGTKLQEIKLL